MLSRHSLNRGNARSYGATLDNQFDPMKSFSHQTAGQDGRLNMKKDFPFGFFLIAAIATWAVYTWSTDETRITHPNHQASTAYQACVLAADHVFDRSLQEANTDPSVWIGYKSAWDYAKTAKSIALGLC